MGISLPTTRNDTILETKIVITDSESLQRMIGPFGTTQGTQLPPTDTVTSCVTGAKCGQRFSRDLSCRLGPETELGAVAFCVEDCCSTREYLIPTTRNGTVLETKIVITDSESQQHMIGPFGMC